MLSLAPQPTQVLGAAPRSPHTSFPRGTKLHRNPQEQLLGVSALQGEGQGEELHPTKALLGRIPSQSHPCVLSKAMAAARRAPLARSRRPQLRSLLAPSSRSADSIMKSGTVRL